MVNAIFFFLKKKTTTFVTVIDIYPSEQKLIFAREALK